jgi:hypothetical protein
MGKSGLVRLAGMAWIGEEFGQVPEDPDQTRSVFSRKEVFIIISLQKHWG